MNNEPVAVVDHRQQNGVTWLKVIKGRSVMPEHNTLLYTHPAKTLTDEEIEQVRVAIMGCAYWCADENMPEAYNAIKVCCGQVLGILVKAQEK